MRETAYIKKGAKKNHNSDSHSAQNCWKEDLVRFFERPFDREESEQYIDQADQIAVKNSPDHWGVSEPSDKHKR